MANGLNRHRCAFQRNATNAYCQKIEVPLFEIQAHAANTDNQSRIAALDFLDDDATSKVPLLFRFYLGMPVMITKRLKELDILRVVSNGTLGSIIGFVHHDGSSSTTNDAYFDISQDGDITVKRFKKLPMLLLIKVRNCEKILVEGYPPGVIGLPAIHDSVQISLPWKPFDSPWSPTLDQFGIIGCLGMTPEKLQGVTLFNKLYIGELDRPLFSPACFYVALSRVLRMLNLVLSHKLTMEYVNKFRPPLFILLKMKEILGELDFPPYGSTEDRMEAQR
jgi:hypothetical protein